MVTYVICLHIDYNYYWEKNIVVVAQFLASIGNVKAQLNNYKKDEQKAEDSVNIYVHVDVEHPVLGHTRGVIYRNRPACTIFSNVTTIAIGGGITSSGVENVDENNIRTAFQIFNSLLPSFCKTATPGYNYRFYFAYDFTDPVLTDPSLLDAFKKTFAEEMRRLCDEPRNIKSSLHMVQCSHSGKPTWAQNDAMMVAYLDHVDYYYRVNDDTNMVTGGWVEAFIATLNQYNPRLVGVVGPNHTGGRKDFLTYDFVHRTHIDIFGLYYPRLFTDYWGDVWMTEVYKPNRSTKRTEIILNHTQVLGQRYKAGSYTGGKKLSAQLKHDADTLDR